MKSKILGGILLVTGTCIGGGMLGLPIASAKMGMLNSILLFVGCWSLMTFTALLTLEVNLCFPQKSNIISMAKATFGKPGAFLCWTVYLCFLYALVSAYIASGQDVLNGLFIKAGLHMPLAFIGIIFVTIFGSIVVAGIRHVDIFNRLLMIIKLLTVAILIFFIALHIDTNLYHQGRLKYILPAMTVAITSFGFSIIVPSLRTYFNDDIKSLRLIILLGSLIPLLCYIAWNGVIFGLIPLKGQLGLERLLSIEQPVTGLLDSIIYFIKTKKIIFLARVFTSICVLTAFACVTLGLWDYLRDGFKIINKNTDKFTLTLATFIPPLTVVIFFPQAFILLLSVAGLFCILLQALLPALMAWRCRYNLSLSMSYQVFGGKYTLLIAIFISLSIALITSYQLFTHPI